MNKNIKKTLLIFTICILLAACCKDDIASTDITVMEHTTESVAEAEKETETETVPETPAKKDISEYEDCTVMLPNTFKEIADNPNIIPRVVTSCSGSSFDTIEDLCSQSVCVVRGEIIDLAYVEAGGFGGTVYSFAVEEVLSGDGIQQETIVSMIDSQGYVSLRHYREVYGADSYSQYSGEEAERTYLVNTSGEPLVEIGEEYVLFIYDINTTWSGKELDGVCYDVISPFLGKFKLNEDGLYERFLPDYEKDLYELKEPISLEEIKVQIEEAKKNGKEE